MTVLRVHAGLHADSCRREPAIASLACETWHDVVATYTECKVLMLSKDGLRYAAHAALLCS